MLLFSSIVCRPCVSVSGIIFELIFWLCSSPMSRMSPHQTHDHTSVPQLKSTSTHNDKHTECNFNRHARALLPLSPADEMIERGRDQVPHVHFSLLLSHSSRQLAQLIILMSRDTICQQSKCGKRIFTDTNSDLYYSLQVNTHKHIPNAAQGDKQPHQIFNSVVLIDNIIIYKNEEFLVYLLFRNYLCI